jgi:hypothetical protein
MKWYVVAGVWAVYTLGVGWLAFPNNLAGWIAGVILAALLFLADRLLYVWWLKPYEQLSIQIQYWWQRRDWRSAGRLLIERGQEQTKLVLRSIIFVLSWPLLAVYVLSSTGSVTGSGLVMGLGLGLALAIGTDWHNIRQLKRWLFWQVKREMTEQEVRFMAGTFIGLFILLTILVIAR